MSTPRQHHYLPKFYLRGFERDGELWVYQKGRELRRSSADKEARQRDLYSYRDNDGNLVAAFETWLGDIESAVAPLVPRIEARGFRPSDDEKEALFWFVATMFSRVPSALRVGREKVGPASERIIVDSARSPEAFQKFCRQEAPWLPPDTNLEELRLHALKPNVFASHRDDEMELLSMAEGARQGVEAMRRFHIQYVHAREEDGWIATDEPVVTMYQTGEKQGIGVGFTTPGVKVLMALSSRVALLLGEDVHAADGEAPGYVIRGLNKFLIQCTSRVFYSGQQSPRLKKAADRHIGTYIRGENVNIPMWDGRFI
jgi:hypothetical protein